MGPLSRILKFMVLIKTQHTEGQASKLDQEKRHNLGETVVE